MIISEKQVLQLLEIAIEKRDRLMQNDAAWTTGVCQDLHELIEDIKSQQSDELKVIE